MIEFKNVSKKYDSGIVALSDINLIIEKGEFLFVVGPSGSGKSTLLKLITKQALPTSGEIFYKGQRVRNVSRRKVHLYRRNFGVVYQDFKLLDNKTAFENVAFAMEIVGKSKKDINNDVPEVLKLVGLEDREKSYPHELSGGEAQRLSIARAIVNKPEVLIADEPTGNLDLDTAFEIMKIIEKVHSFGTTVIMSTHSQPIVDNYNNRVIKVEDGKIISDYIGGYHGEN